MDWNDVIPAEKVDYIFGNPPFVGKRFQNAVQKADMNIVFAGIKGAGVLDYVSAWYMKAVQYVKGDDRTNNLSGSPPNIPGERVKVAAAHHDGVSSSCRADNDGRQSLCFLQKCFAFGLF